MGIGEDDLLMSSVTVMPVLNGMIGFLRRDPEDTYAGLLVAPGGSIETPDGIIIDGVRYYAAEYAAVREMREKCGMTIHVSSLRYFCSLALPGHRTTKHRLVVSFYTNITVAQVGRSFGWLEFLDIEGIRSRNDFVPGMKQEALQLLLKHGLMEVNNVLPTRCNNGK